MEEDVAKKLNNLFKSFQEIGDVYKSKIGKGISQLDKEHVAIFKNQIPQVLYSVFPQSDYKIKGSIGQGKVTKCPWIAIMNRLETTTTQQGVYLVFLLSKDLKRVYFQLAQGVTQTDYKDLISLREKIRSTLKLQNEYLLLFNDQDIDNENYKTSSIYANEWDCNDDLFCTNLLKEFKRAYEEYMKAKNTITESATVMENSDNEKHEVKMTAHGVFSSLLAKYREALPSFWEDEKYKWEAVTHFQKHWDIEADDFSAMLTEATSKHVNLLDVKMYFPIGVLRDYIELDKERTREMFRVLFDESKDITERISYFSNEAEAIRKLGGDRWKNHYQNLHAISVYLTFMYPNKYFIYKYTELHNTIERLGDNFTFPGQKTPPSFYSKVIDYCEGLRVRIAADKAVCNELDKQISNSPECFADQHRNIATVDFIYYVGKRLKDIPSAGDPKEDGPVIEPDENSRYWIYAPGEGASMWQLCQDEGIMVLGWNKIGDYRQYESHEQLISDMQEAYNKHDKNFMHSSLAVWQFLHDMKVGDVIFVKQGLGKIIGRGVVQGDYEYDEKLNERFPNKRRVHWTHIGEWDTPVGLPRKTLTRFYENSTSIFMLERLFFPELKPAIEQIPFSIDKVIKDIDETGLIYTPALIKRFAFSLMTKPFVILSGLAGSGKTQLAITFAKTLVEDTDTQVCIVSVGADWTNREPLLGFPNALQPNQYVRPESRVLDLLIEASMPENANKPYFLILDEMNMSYVERYFADFLSAMESKEAIPLWNGCLDPDREDDDSDDTPTSIKLPSNLFIIGTINVDETTYMFSPKVLDRANVIEFKISVDEMTSFLENMKDVNPDNIISKAANMAASFVEIASKNDLEKDALAVETLKKFFGELKNVNAEFGYRSATEIFRFICQAKNNDDTAVKITDNEILDAAIVQKLLPKLHGSRKKLDPVLKQLWRLCFDGAESDSQIAHENAKKAKFKESADKIWRMYESAIANGFTSFAEA